MHLSKYTKPQHVQVYASPECVSEKERRGANRILTGNPGSGKTVLAGSIIHELKKNDHQSDTDSAPEVCYYFFSQNLNTRNSPVDAYRAIATQMFEYFKMFEKVSNIFALGIRSGAVLQKSSEDEIVDTISQCLPHLPNLYFVVDAIDECSHSDRLIRQLSKWCDSSPLKVVMLSRPDVAGLRRRIPRNDRIILGGAHVNADIARYLQLEVETLVEEGLLSENVDQVAIVSHLVGRAEGMFLWARLIIAYLNGPAMTRAQRLATIMERNTEGLDQLDEMYKRIETRINSMDPHSKSMSRKALMWVAHVGISPEELKDALFPEGWDMEPRGISEQFEHAVIVVCGGLVEKGPQPTNFFRYIHLTALEFVQPRSRCPLHHSLIPSAPESKALITTRLISFLQAIPQGPLSGVLGEAASPATVLYQLPLLRLATDWIDFSLQTIAVSTDSSTNMPEKVIKMADNASKYLKNRLSIMVWVEAWYNLRTSPEGSQSCTTNRFESLRDDIVSLSTRIQNLESIENLLSNLRDFANDLINLDVAWASLLRGSPHEIWGDVTIFTKSRFLVPTTAGSAQCLAPEMVVEPDLDTSKTTKPTFSVSMSSADGRQLAVLAIFPCEYVMHPFGNTR